VVHSSNNPSQVDTITAGM